MKYYLIAGERSGDLHGANLMKGIRQHDPDAEFRAWGGDLMQAQGAALVMYYTDLAFMGFLEVARNITTILGFLKKCKADILDYRPDVLILIDYPGFNLRIAAFAKKKGVKVCYYISPKVWAWNQKRAWKIKASVDRMFVIFPFEVDFYKKYGYEVTYVGNPLMDAIESFTPNPDFLSQNRLDNKRIIALLPGSRKQEVTGMLDTMLSIKSAFPQHEFVVAGVNSLPASLYEPYRNLTNVTIVFEATYDLLSVAEAALVASGTATLETALFAVPEVVCYQTSGISYAIAKRLIRVPFISLVNLIMEKESVRELIQDDFSEEKLTTELQAIVPDGHKRKAIEADYRILRDKVGAAGASQRAGAEIVSYLRG
ncbi:lipid-A-disaccharide synthase [Persicitalea jodogahamensis]|uniref:Lipid-A-disaccharide synthase n=1 Tax=Persicitalea jodogahamensis TaxID=402147 RepID=A0A8J3G9U8_9BACT|nr:lipid-A-disaccharide synthase [Persicitalea jodogahamensis]GHB78029.1 lipid-A-disaccharide synthase [Persicitalea jodogahamensis]